MDGANRPNGVLRLPDDRSSMRSTVREVPFDWHLCQHYGLLR